MKIKRTIDHLLSSSGSVFSQFGLWFLLVMSVFFILLAISFFSENINLSLENFTLQFLNPGSSFPNDSLHEIDTTNKRWALTVGFIGVIIMSGLLIPCVGNIIARRVEKIQNGQVSYSFRNHCVIIGFNEMLASVVIQLYDDNKKRNTKCDIVIQTSQDVKEVRRQLDIELKNEHFKYMFFIHGAANSAQDLKKLYIKNAKRIVILGDNNAEAHDALNMKCLEQIVSELSVPDVKNKNMVCDVLFNDYSSYAILQKMNIDNNWHNKIYFRPFNFHESWAQKVVVHNKAGTFGNPEINYMPLDGCNGIQCDSGKYVHFVIMGMNRMGLALGVEAARIMHLPNFVRNNNLKTHITFIDPNAEQEMNVFVSHYPHLFELVDFDYTDTTQENCKCEPVDQYKYKDLAFKNFLDIRFSFVKGCFKSPQIRKLLSDWSEDKSTVMTIAVCNDDTAKSMDIGLFLPPLVFEKEIPVYIQQKETSCFFSEMINKNNKYKRFRNVRPFGMLNECFSSKEIEETEKIAKRIMWVYNTYYYYRAPENKGGKGFDFNTALQKTKDACIDSNEKLNETWQKLAVAKRWANIYNAFSVGVKYRSFNISGMEINKDDLELLAKVEHNRWNVERLIFGYRAVTMEENTEICSNRECKSAYRDEEFCHYDLRPYDLLDFDDSGINTYEYDIVISECLTKIHN